MCSTMKIRAETVGFFKIIVKSDSFYVLTMKIRAETVGFFKIIVKSDSFT